VTSQRLWLARWLLGCLVLIAPAHVLAVPSAPETDRAIVATGEAQPGLLRLAQHQPAQPAPQTQAPAANANAPAASEEPIGNVASVTGVATVTRNNTATPLKLKDDIYLNDVVQTSVSSSLGITFNDATTFNLRASSQITIDNYVYEDGGKSNAAVFDVAKGTVAFVAASVAKTGNMSITTPTATLGIRGTTGLVEVPEGAAAASANNVNIKLYPDEDGRVGHIEVNDRAGLRLGALTQGASGFAIRPGFAGGARFAAVPLTISPQQALRDQGFVSQVHATQGIGRRIVTEQRAFRRANPGLNRNQRPGQPGQQRPNGLPQQNRPGQQQQQQRPGAPQQPGTPQQPGQPQRFNGQQPQPNGQPQRQGLQGQPGQGGGAPPNGVLPRQAGPQQPGVQRSGGQRFGAPGVQRPPLQGRPLIQRRPPPRDKREQR
jgi:FecR protein